MSGSIRLEQKQKETSKEKVTVEAAAPQELEETVLSSSLGSLIDIVRQVLDSYCAHVTCTITVLILRFYYGPACDFDHGR